jgi:hypothetical protein
VCFPPALKHAASAEIGMQMPVNNQFVLNNSFCTEHFLQLISKDD